MAKPSPRDRYLQALMAHVAEDRYPSATQMDAIETMLAPNQVGAYVDLLVEKLLASKYPSIPMMRRLERVLQQLPQQR